MRRIATSVEYVGGPDCGGHAVIPVPPGGLPPLLPDRHGSERYHATGALTATRRHRYDWHAEHTGNRAKPYCTCLNAGCPSRPRTTP